MEFVVWYRNIPKLTKYYLTALIITLLVTVNVLKLHYFHLDFKLIYKRYQV